MAKIGIDFDNTIACYTNVFTSLAVDFGYFDGYGSLSKSELKKKVLSSSGSENEWMRIQGLAYGKFISRAEPYPGLLEFLINAKFCQDEVFIVSHKTIYGHFDEEKINLRTSALFWLVENLTAVHEGENLISTENIFFLSNQEEKIRKIEELKLDYFIDDLDEVLGHESFPLNVNKILFNPIFDAFKSKKYYAAGSWRDIRLALYGCMSNEFILFVINKYLEMPEILSVDTAIGRSNSSIYKLCTRDHKQFILKIYPDRSYDKRPRIENDTQLHEIMYSCGLPVPKLIAKNTGINWAIFEFIQEVENTRPPDFIEELVNFLVSINTSLNNKKLIPQFKMASEACLSLHEICKQIEYKKIKIKKNLPVISDYLDNEFSPEFLKIKNSIMRLTGDNFTKVQDIDCLLLSPSDFGRHNAILNMENKYIYIDFEYFGWDDPAKIIADFYWHPAMRLSDLDKDRWIAMMLNKFNLGDEFMWRLNSYLPLIGLRWCMIILMGAMKMGDGAGRISELEMRLSVVRKLMSEIKGVTDYGR